MRVLENGRRRHTLGFRTACEADNGPHVRYDAAQRAEIVARVEAAVAIVRNADTSPA